MKLSPDQDYVVKPGPIPPKLIYRAVLAGILLILWMLLPILLHAEPLYSPSWGYRIDLPEDFALQERAGNDKFSFSSPDGVTVDLAAYPASAFESVELLVDDLQKRLKNSGGVALFDYYGMAAAVVELRFAQFEGWALCVELGEADETETETETENQAAPEAGREQRPKLLALAYGPRRSPQLHPLMFSALDSIAPTRLHSIAPGPITEFSYPRENKKKVTLANSNTEAWIYDSDAEAAFRFWAAQLSTTGFGICVFNVQEIGPN
jgi:hypothetical protein